MNNKVIFSLGIVGVFVLVVIYFLTQPTPHTETSIPTATPSSLELQHVENLVDKSATWKTFTSTNQAYSVKIPPDWEPEETPDGGIIIRQKNSTNLFEVDIHHPGNQTAQEFVEKNIYPNSNYPDSQTRQNFLNKIKYIPTILANKPAYRIEGMSNSQGNLGPALWIPNDQGNGVYLASLQPVQDDTFDEFVFTFKFLR